VREDKLMRNIMQKSKNRYINLENNPLRMSGRRGFSAALHSRPVQLAKRIMSRTKRRSSGVYLTQSPSGESQAGKGFNRILEFLVYGSGLILVSLGFYNILGKRNGGQLG